eukprot:14589597-Alexandrium_andersonii.AAC.1
MIHGPAVRARMDRAGMASHRAWVPARAMMHACLRACACGPCGEASEWPCACARAVRACVWHAATPCLLYTSDAADDM